MDLAAHSISKIELLVPAVPHDVRQAVFQFIADQPLFAAAFQIESRLFGEIVPTPIEL